MHEMALCTEVVRSVIDAAERADAVSVDRVSITVGEMRDIVVDMFDGFFHYLAKGSIAEGAVITYTTVPLTVGCHCCGFRFPVDVRSKDPVRCPGCGESDYELASGAEFFIESIEVTTKAERAEAHRGEFCRDAPEVGSQR